MDTYYEKYVPHCDRCGSRNIKWEKISRNADGKYNWDGECKECGALFMYLDMPCHVDYFLNQGEQHEKTSE